MEPLVGRPPFVRLLNDASFYTYREAHAVSEDINYSLLSVCIAYYQYLKDL